MNEYENAARPFPAECHHPDGTREIVVVRKTFSPDTGEILLGGGGTRYRKRLAGSGIEPVAITVEPIGEGCEKT